jgi:hypothetical protein
VDFADVDRPITDFTGHMWSLVFFPWHIALIERAQFAHNPRCYFAGGIPALKERGIEGSWLEWFLKETETFQGELCPLCMNAPDKTFTAKARRFTR